MSGQHGGRSKTLEPSPTCLWNISLPAEESAPGRLLQYRLFQPHNLQVQLCPQAHTTLKTSVAPRLREHVYRADKEQFPETESNCQLSVQERIPETQIPTARIYWLLPISSNWCRQCLPLGPILAVGICGEEAEEKDLKYIFMKVIETLQEEMKKIP